MTKQALITGVTGQDGYYLSQLLVSRGYRVVGTTRQLESASALAEELGIEIVALDLHSPNAWLKTIETYGIDEIYHLAGVSFVPTSWTSPLETISANLEVTVHLLETMRAMDKPPRLFYACSSEVFGQPVESPQHERTSKLPLNPYGVTKAASMGMIESYRRRYGLFACSGILFNHESPRRASSFVTRKISQAVAAIRLGLQDRLLLGNLDVARDWGYAADYVECMFRMLQAEVADDYVIGTGRLSSLEQVVECAFSHVQLNWRDWVSLDPSFARPNEVRAMVADCSKAWKQLNWKATTSLEQIIEMMVDHDLNLLQHSKRRAA